MPLSRTLEPLGDDVVLDCYGCLAGSFAIDIHLIVIIVSCYKHPSATAMPLTKLRDFQISLPV